VSALIELFEQLARFAIAPLLLGLIATAGVLALIRNWRIALPMLIVQYVLVGLLLARAIPATVAIIKPLAGAVVCLALSVAAQRADSARRSRGESVAQERVERYNWRGIPAQFLVRAVAVVLVMTAAFSLASRFTLPGGSRALSFAALALLGSALLIIATAPEAITVGMGVLMFISGVELGYTPLEPSVTVSVLLGLMTLLVGVAVAYLTVADGGALTPATDSQSIVPGAEAVSAEMSS
jgi:hypothetical protein